jgi:hypothetical protein
MSDLNPFAAADADRGAIWEVLVRRDSDFFLSGDWSLIANDYVEDGFLGIDAGGNADPSRWTIGFPSLAAYRDAAIAGRLMQPDFFEDLRAAWLRCQTLPRIEISGDLALAHKRIDGSILRADNTRLRLAWRSIFFMRRVQGSWKITGFTGYLPP